MVSRLLTLLLLVCLQSLVAGAEALPSGQGNFRHSSGLKVFFHKPPQIRRILFVMHGRDRNAGDYIKPWVSFSLAQKVLILAPEFDRQNYPGSRAYNWGNVIKPSGLLNAPGLWSFSRIEEIFSDILAREKVGLHHYDIFGHSAGAQFVHRMLYLVPDARIATAIAANAGSYTLPDPDIAYPFGLQGVPAYPESAFSRSLVVLLGELDNDPKAPGLPEQPQARSQGPHRLARGQKFFEQARRAAQDKPFRWRLQTVPGVAHSHSRMARAAQALLSR